VSSRRERAVAREQPDAVVVGIRMPPTQTDEGLVAARRIRAEHPGTAVLVLSQHVEPGYALSLLEDYPELSNRAIAVRLVVAERTVESHITQTFIKLHLGDDPTSHRRVRAVLAYLRSPSSGDHGP